MHESFDHPELELQSFVQLVHMAVYSPIPFVVLVVVAALVAQSQ